ncbi:extracellular catalytic domain type 1 short-chain-length polyhydroxyalkanoate depolymerase [Polymorphobacter multimanifer]|uniref:extracellular catalytic domain type 1 short-chain-length polyhydroxyalkanoate depolymerase n=1 Tax=Polymorphobacter multimanifer TaxID=1070431 RepID=UPI00237A7C41|nr:PHB depolymerase family esterase [Polymorphobacter multimanifer]
MVVALHGCTQTAALYARASGWQALAARHDFALLLPEQTKRNNQSLCFSWFDPNAVRHGEGAAILRMVDTVSAAHGLDPSRCYITGLSAGAAMLLALLEAHPGRFAAAAPLAGVPAGAALDVASGLNAMAGGVPAAAQLARHVPQSPPPLSLWHGLADDRVHPRNAEHLAIAWALAGGTVESHLIPGLGHAQPIGPDGTPGQHFVRGLGDSTSEIAHFFGLH